jgi:hypothetical protein
MAITCVSIGFVSTTPFQISIFQKKNQWFKEGPIGSNLVPKN